MGTSPFIGAGQFGTKSLMYYSKFYLNPRNIVRIISKSIELGVRGIQVLPEKPVIWAIKEVLRRYEEKLIIVPSIFNVKDIELMQEFDCPLMLIHGALTDQRNPSLINKLLNHIGDIGALGGLITHTPVATMKWLINKEFEYEVLMIPLNKAGYMMDGSLAEIGSLISKLGKKIIAKKVLAAGRLPVFDAIEFISKLKFVDAIALGIASEEEAEETFSTAFKVFVKRS